MNETQFVALAVAIGLIAAAYIAYREIMDRRIAKAQRLEEADRLSMPYLNRPARAAYYNRMAALSRLEGEMGKASSYERLADLVGYQERALP